MSLDIDHYRTLVEGLNDLENKTLSSFTLEEIFSFEEADILKTQYLTSYNCLIEKINGDEYKLTISKK